MTAFDEFLTGGIGFDDSIQVNIGVGLNDGIGFGEAIGLVDRIGFDDVLGVAIAVGITDGIGFNDVLGVAIATALTGDIGFDDSLSSKMSYQAALVDGIGFDDVALVELTLFPRAKLPMRVSDMWHPAAMRDLGPTGLLQLRATKAVGWSWTEMFGSLNVRNTDHQTLRAFILRAWNRGVIFEATHPLVPGSGISPNGLGTFGVTVSGAAQVDDMLITAGWPGSVLNVARAGDAIKIVGDDAVYLVTEDANATGGGVATLILTPHLRSSPVNGAQVITTGVLFRAHIVKLMEDSYRSPVYFQGLEVEMTEALPI